MNRNRHRLVLAATVALGVTFPGGSRLGRAADNRAWWHEGWEHRVKLVIPPAPGSGRLPVTIAGSVLRQAGVEGDVPVGSLRVVGSPGEIPCQVDERDGTGELIRHGNRLLDDDDELVFFIDCRDVAASYFIYFSRHPRPPGKYVSKLRYGRPSGAFNDAVAHGTFYAGDLKVSVKGPKLTDPMARSKHNYCSGAISALQWRGHRFISPSRAWTWFIPNHPFGATPSTVIWSLPKLIVDGPVRKVVCLEATGLPAPVESVRHYVAVYADRGVVDFEEVIEYGAVEKDIKLSLGFPIGMVPDFVTASGSGEGLARRELTEEERSAQREGKVVVVSRSDQATDARPWWAWCSPARRVGLATFFAKHAGSGRGLMDGERWSSLTYVRRDQNHTRVTLGFVPQKTVRHAMRFCCIEDFDGVPLHFRVWSDASLGWARLGRVETRSDR